MVGISKYGFSPYKLVKLGHFAKSSISHGNTRDDYSDVMRVRRSTIYHDISNMAARQVLVGGPQPKYN